MGDTYQKATGSAGSKGVNFQVDLLSVFLLNALRHNIKGWKLSTENKLAGKFDDVVLELCDRSSILLQAKHKETKKINLDQLLSTNSKNDDFSLPKYFLSYLDVKTKFPVKSVIVCSNAQANENILKYINHNNVCPKSMPFCQDGASFCTFTDSIVSDLTANARVYYRNNLVGKGVDETLITEENVKEFLKHLQFYFEYQSGTDLEKAAEKLLSTLKSSSNLFHNVSYRDLHQKVKSWFEQPKGEYLTESLAKAIFCQIKSDKWLEYLDDYKVFFKNHDVNIIDLKKRILYVVAEKGHLLHLIKIYRNLQHDKFKILYTGTDYGGDVQKQAIKAFELPQYTHLIIALPTFSEESTINEICITLWEILQSRDYKKVIFVTESENKLAQKMKSISDDYDILDNSPTLEDLSEDTQEMLLKKKIVRFQGEVVSLEELLPEQATCCYKKYIKSGLLQMLITGEKCTVGTGFKDLEKEMSRYYVDRKFERIVEKVWKENERATERKEIISEEEICSVNEKIILISDSAGMGKTTVLKNLAIRIKKNNPRLWVIRIELNRCTNILRDCLLNNKSINIWELMNCNHFTHSANELGEILFALKGTVVLMLDGVDEISPYYTDLILDVLLQSQKAENFIKVFVTTRCHLVREFEQQLNVTSFRLVPLTEQDQVDFFTRYWACNLKLEGGSISKCERYANTLIANVSSWIREWYSGVKFVASPLHARMLVEIFLENKKSEEWQGCKEYLSAEDMEPKLPNKMNISRLYAMFIEKKRAVFMNKGNPSGNTMANQALDDQFQECLVYHRSLALNELLDEKECTCFSCYKCDIRDNDERTVLKMGIVQKLNNQLIFIHRTFAEYFVAESIFKELQLRKSDVGFQRFLIDNAFVNKKYITVRHYLDDFLQKGVSFLPSGICKGYMSLVNDSNKSSLIHRLASEGNIEIIRFVLKLINFKIRRSRKRSLIKYKRFFKKRNTLSILKDLVNCYGIDVKDCGWAPLHYAVLGGHLDTVKFILEMGADVNCKSEYMGMVLNTENWSAYSGVFKYHEIFGMDMNSKIGEGHTPLHLAAGCRWLDIVELLIERGANVNVETDDGITPLHYACWCGWLDVVELLVQRSANVNISDNEGNTAVHFAAIGERFDVLKFLVQHGADIHSANRFGNTSLHFATEVNSFDIVEYLVKHDVDLDAADLGGYTALHFAIETNSLDMIEFLVDHGADIDTTKHFEGFLALQLAVLRGNCDIIEFLVERGANINSADSKGDTALHYAVRMCNLTVVELLVRHNADVDVKNKKGHTAAYCAWKDKSSEIFKFLVEHMPT